MPPKSFWARLPFGVRMTIGGLGMVALVAGTGSGIAALVGEDRRVVGAVGQPAPVVELPPPEVPAQSPTDETGLGTGAVGHAEAERTADETRSAPGEADRTATRWPRRTTSAHGAMPGGGAQTSETAGHPATRPAPGTRPATGSRPAPGSRPASGSRPAAGARPVAGSRPAPGARPAAGSRPATGSRPAAGPRPVAGARPVAGGRPAAGAGPAGPRVRTVRISKTEDIPFRTTLIRDPWLPPGVRELEEPGVPGERLVRYEVTYAGNRERSRRLLGSTVTREPLDKIVAVGDPDRGSGRHDRDQQRECGLLGSCGQQDDDVLCTDGDEYDPGQSIIDGDLSLLDPSDLDEWDPPLPCEDDAAWVTR